MVPGAERVQRRFALSLNSTASSVTEQPHIIIRDIEQILEMREVEVLQKEVWGSDDRDLVPSAIFAATREVGAILIGAFDGASLIGFAYSFLGRENGRVIQHSHQLAVRPAYRHFNLGYKLKLAQRERVLAQDITRMTWTFDPLQSLNAHFNFSKLGVVADAYKINFYGEATSSFLHRIGTDRLWVSWQLDSLRVRERLQIEDRNRAAITDLERIAWLVRVGPNDEPERNELTDVPRHEHLLIEIPTDINRLQRESPESAVMWREATRRAFAEAISAGYLVEEFYRSSRRDRPGGTYLLSSGKSVADFV